MDQGGLQTGAALLAKAAYKKPAADYPLQLAPVFQLNMGTQAMAIPDYNLPTLRENEFKGTSMFVALNAATAKAAGVAQGDKVVITSEAGSFKASVDIDESVMPGVVAAHLGFGHTAWDKFAKGRGDNVNKALAIA